MENNTFYGESRNLLVTGLVALYNDCVTSHESLVVALEAPSGWGKTRVAQEFYARLAAAQPEPRYWPDRIDDPDQGRKAVRPAPFTRGGKSLPHFFWWGIACTARNGVRTSMLRDDLKQLSKHSIYLDEASKRLRSKGGRVATVIGTAGKTIAKQGTQDFVGKAADLLLGDLVPIVGIPYRLTRMGITAGSAHWQRRKTLAAATLLGESDYSDIVDEAVELFADVCEVGLPLVVFVEDIHAADEVLIQVLDELVRIRGPIFIISTTWPDMVKTNEHLARFFDSHIDRIVPVGHEDDAGTKFPPGASLRELELEAREDMVHNYYSQVRADTLNTIVERYNNPMALDLACRLLKKKHPSEHLDLHPDEITKRLPRKISDLYRQIWYELPEGARISLAVAHLITPKTIASEDSKNIEPYRDRSSHVTSSSQASGEDRWTHSILRDVIERLDLPSREEVKGELARSPHAYAWVRIIDEYLRSFVEPVQQAIVQREALELLEEELDTDDARSAILTVLTDVLIGDSIDSTRSTNVGRTILALHAEGFIADQEVVAKAIEVLLQDLEDAPRELSERIRLYESFLQLDVDNISVRLRRSIDHHGAVALALSDDTQRAIDIFQALLDEMEQELGPVDIATVTTRLNLAFIHGLAGNPNTAIDLCEAALNQLEGRLERGDRELLIAQASRARWLGEAGRVKDAVSIYRDVVTDAERFLQPDDPLTLMFQNNLGRWLGELDSDAAVKIYRDLLERRLKVLPPNHPSIFYTRYNLAINLRRSGDIAEAVSILEAQDEHAVETFGIGHPHLVHFRTTLALSMAETDRIQDGIEVATELLDRANDVGSISASQLLELRLLLLTLYMYAEDDENAIPAIADYLELRSTISDRADELIVALQRELVSLLTAAEYYTNAIDTCTDLLESQLELYGAETEDTLTTRYNLVNLYGRSEQWDQAIDACRTLIRQSAGILQPSDPRTLTIRGHLARLLMDSEWLTAAAQEYEELIRDLDEQDLQVRQLALSQLALCYRQLGEVQELIETYNHMVENLLKSVPHEALGASADDVFQFVADFADILIEHRDPADAVSLYESTVRWASSMHSNDVRLVRVHNMAARVYQRVGRNEAAIESYEHALRLGSEFLPSDHLECLVSRNNLAVCYYGIKSYSTAISHCESLLDVLSSAQGEHAELRFSMRALLVSVYSDCEQRDRSIEALSDLLQDQRETLGREDARTLDTECLLDVRRAQLKRDTGAEEL